MKVRLLFLCLSLSLGMGCASKEKSEVGEFTFFNDFEGQFGYNPYVAVGKTSHSGKAFCRMGTDLEFSPAFIQQFKAISSKRFSKVIFTTHVLMPDPNATGAIAIQVWSPENAPIKVAQRNFSSTDFGTNRWSEISFELSLEGLDEPENQLRCFVHNPNKQNLYLDDFRIELVPLDK